MVKLRSKLIKNLNSKNQSQHIPDIQPRCFHCLGCLGMYPRGLRGGLFFFLILNFLNYFDLIFILFITKTAQNQLNPTHLRLAKGLRFALVIFVPYLPIRPVVNVCFVWDVAEHGLFVFCVFEK